jgi:CYTH domain-containing protein
VFNVPEVPTIYSAAGWNYLTPNRKLYYQGERAILETQLALENQFMRLAEVCEDPVLIVCDRGAMDISAYMEPDMWERITKAVGTNTQHLRDERYDPVLHLVSAADGAEQFYTTSNNASRNEPASEEGLRIARLLDKKVIEAWTGHGHLRVINNHEDFEAKIRRVIKEITNVLGLPQPIEEERKYIVEVVGEMPDCIESDITQTYLVADPGVEVRLRRRDWHGKVVNVHTTKKKISGHEEIITERQVPNALYESLMQQADPYRQTIHKNRKSFIWKGQYFELDTYLNLPQPLTILETKGITEDEDVRFPPFIRVVADITCNKKYYNYNLALRR